MNKLQKISIKLSTVNPRHGQRKNFCRLRKKYIYKYIIKNLIYIFHWSRLLPACLWKVEVQFHEFDFRCCWLIGILPLIREIPAPILGHERKFYGSTPSHFTRTAELPTPDCLLMFLSSRLSSLFTCMLIDKILDLLDIGQKNGRETQQQEETGKHQVSSSSKSLGSIHVASVPMRLALSFSFRTIYTRCIWQDVKGRDSLDAVGKVNGLPWIT